MSRSCLSDCRGRGSDAAKALDADIEMYPFRDKSLDAANYAPFSHEQLSSRQALKITRTLYPCGINGMPLARLSLTTATLGVYAGIALYLGLRNRQSR